MDQIAEVKIAQMFSEASQLYATRAPSIEALERFNVALETARSVVWNAGAVAASAAEQRRGLPRVFIGLPYCHNVQIQTMKALLVEFSADRVVPDFQEWASSLLAFAFNNLWCCYLNSSKAFDYFLLCHADIGFRTKNFLDPLIEDMETHNLDVIHVPQPIKDMRGLTSTAVGSDDNRWGWRRRVTMAELDKLPDVFGLEHVLEVMGKGIPKNPVFLPNTAVFLVKTAPWRWEFPGFCIEDRIIKSVEGSKVVARAEVVPEDWNFGWWAHSQGLRVGGSKRVKTDHWLSKVCYKNDEIWGEEQDKSYLISNPVE